MRRGRQLPSPAKRRERELYLQADPLPDRALQLSGRVGGGGVPTPLLLGLGLRRVKELSVSDNGQLRPVTWYGGKGMGDVRTLSAEFLLSLQDLWRRRGDEILERVADQFPELLFSGMIKLSRVLKVEVGGAGDFAKLGKQGILEKLQEKGGPEARRLFETFMRNVEKLQSQQEQKDG